MNSRTRIDLLKEATAIEEAGDGRWTQKHASAVTGYSVSFLRNSNCPKRVEDGEGPKGKPRVFYLPEEVREWMRQRNAKSRKVA